jgi:hypothetical protein
MHSRMAACWELFFFSGPPGFAHLLSVELSNPTPRPSVKLESLTESA